MPQLNNDNTAYRPRMGDGSRGLVQFVKGGSDDGWLYGSLDGVNYVMLQAFSGNDLKELALPTYVLIAGSATDPTVDLGAASKAYISETR